MSHVEQWVLNTWKEIFNTSDISLSSDFFELGGNSLTALKLLSRVEEVYGPESLLPDTLFETPSLKGIATAIDDFIKKNQVLSIE